MSVPIEIQAPRFVLRPWRADDATALLPVLEANVAHLGPWIPARVSTPVPLAALAERLTGFGNDFAAAREWRYGMFGSDGTTVLGDAGIYPRAANGRAPYASATHVELGYWLRADATGQGLVTDAMKILLDVIAGLDHVSHVEIRCDERNVSSAAIPQRLGFVLSPMDSQLNAHLQVWTRDATRHPR
jgi:RimJ/RimL family protein N-acetyltransferase